MTDFRSPLRYVEDKIIRELLENSAVQVLEDNDKPTKITIEDIEWVQNMYGLGCDRERTEK